MTYQITRHARIAIPKALKPMFTIQKEISQEESKGFKKFCQKSLVVLPISSFGFLGGMTVFSPSLASIGLVSGTIGYSALVVGSAVTLAVTAVPILKDISTGRRKYLPGKNEKTYVDSSIKDIEPYAEWDNVFLPYAVEAFNGVKVKDSTGSMRDPIRLHTTPYVEFRTAPRTTGIEPSVMEAMKI